MREGKKYTDTLHAKTPAASEPVNISSTRNETAIVDDPFAAQRSTGERRLGDNLAALGTSPGSPGTSPKRDRRLSKEWGAFLYPKAERDQKRRLLIKVPLSSRRL